MAIEPEDYDDELPPRSRWPVIVAAILVIAVAITFGANAFFSIGPDLFRTAGDADEFAFLSVDPATDEPIRYDPCTPIHYVVNRSGAPKGAITDLQRGVRIFEGAMQVDFVFDGFTNEVASASRSAFQPDRYGPRWAPILLAWVPARDLLSPDDQAVGAAGSVALENERGRPVYVTGIVTFNANARLLTGYRFGDSWGDVVLHELGHVVGLAHVDDYRQVMYPDVTGGHARLGAGDLEGLRRLGRDGGCVQAPSPS